MRGESRRGRGKGRGAGVGLFHYHFLELFSNPLLSMSVWHRTASFRFSSFYENVHFMVFSLDILSFRV